jgi:serine/threonine-protein kinase RsbW
MRLKETLAALNHDVVEIDNEIADKDPKVFDVVITDLTKTISQNGSSQNGNHTPSSSNNLSIVKSYKLDASKCLHTPYDGNELRLVIQKALECKRGLARDRKQLPYVHETIEFYLPSELLLMDSVVQYMVERVALLGIIDLDQSNLFTALDEAFVNAVKHGNKNDPTKLLRIDSDLSTEEAKIIIEDEGEGFCVENVPDPRDPANLFKGCGRGVLLICNIMDEVKYNARGNRLTMIKRRDDSSNVRPVDSARAEECPIQNQ